MTRITVTYDQEPTALELMALCNCLAQFKNRHEENPAFNSNDILYVNDKTGLKTNIRKTSAGYAVRVLNAENPTA